MFWKERWSRKLTSEKVKEQQVHKPKKFAHELFHELVVPPSVLEKNTVHPFIQIIKDEIEIIGLDEEALVFRGINHPKGNITAQLLAKYGTDRFEGFGRGNLPKEDKDLVPYRNTKEEQAHLTADTYAARDLSWALDHAGFTLFTENWKFQGRDPFLLCYNKSSITEDPSPIQEPARIKFLTEPKDALQGVIYFVSPKI